MIKEKKGKKKILIFGKGGQLSSELFELATVLGEVELVDISEVDFTKPESIRKKLMTEKPDIIINGAAYTQVDRAENEKELVLQINGKAVGEIARCAEKLDALLVHYSTDYVFDGQGTVPYIEKDIISPVNFYGISKSESEKEIVTSNCQHLIFRISWIYSGRGNDFPGKIVELVKEKSELKVVNDQVGSPTWARMVAEKTIEILTMDKAYQKENQGIYHLVSEGYISWYEFAREILKEENVTISPVFSEEFPTPAKRPKNSRLNCQKVQETFGITLPNWRDLYRRFEQEQFEKKEKQIFERSNDRTL